MLKSIVQENTNIKWCFYVFNAGTPQLREKVYSQIVTWESISILKGKNIYSVIVKTVAVQSSNKLSKTIGKSIVILFIFPTAVYSETLQKGHVY